VASRPDPNAPPRRPTWGGRVAEYLLAMFPPLVNVPAGALLFFAVHAGLQGIAGVAPVVVGPRAIAGAATLVLLALLMRVQDELKDVEADLRLAREGDPRFARRPLALGRVTTADLDALRRIVLGALVALNLPLGFPLPFLAFALALLVTWLSGRWFFWPAMAGNPLLAFATHNPIALLDAGYAAAVFARDLPGRLEPRAAFVLLAVYLPIAAWEIARKVRAPGEETSYETWSSRLGWQVAGGLPSILCALSAACFARVSRASALGPLYPALVLAALLLVLGSCLRFLARPSARTARLRPAVEIYALVASGGLVLALALSRGVAWLPSGAR
jgi:4-hydroxybenzoate polyprenyltransferase